MNSRTIRPEVWEHARQSLIFYFSRRHGLSYAEDLAQETLMALWSRADYEFEREEDFLRVCYGFAARVLYQGYRQERKHASSELDPAMPGPHTVVRGLSGIEINVFLAEVNRIGELELNDQEWELIKNTVSTVRSNRVKQTNPGDSNKHRVRLHRARNKLAKLTGWQKSEKSDVMPEK